MSGRGTLPTITPLVHVMWFYVFLILPNHYLRPTKNVKSLEKSITNSQNTIEKSEMWYIVKQQSVHTTCLRDQLEV